MGALELECWQTRHRQCSLAKAFEIGDVKAIEYVQPAPEAALEPAPENAPDTALLYKKDKDKRQPPGYIRENRKRHNEGQTECAKPANSKAHI